MPEADQMTAPVAGPPEIEVGEIAGDGLRLWCAREAKRLAEIALDNQSKAIDRVMTRATSLIGWSSVGTTALASAVMSHALPRNFLWVVVLLGASALASIAALFPGKWRLPGDQGGYVMSQPYESELEMTEALALRAEQSVVLNTPRISRVHSALRVSYVLLIIASLVSFILAF